MTITIVRYSAMLPDEIANTLNWSYKFVGISINDGMYDTANEIIVTITAGRVLLFVFWSIMYLSCYFHYSRIYVVVGFQI